MNINDLLTNLKDMDIEGNIVIPKKHLRKFMLMNILIMQEKQIIDRTAIFNYVKDNGFEVPGAWDGLDKAKQEKFINSSCELFDLMQKF